ncbi:MAG: asparagine synthase (glutamine-hydrolyzing) [Gemmatimonadaceae bacterium]
MCGIAGILYLDGTGAVDDAELAAMGAALVHRGPDHAGRFVSGPIGLASQRLAIIDPEGGNQPIQSDDGAVTIVFNGEIYNHRELRQELEHGGCRFRTHSDTEVILHAYRVFGERCVDRLEGMFAFAIWDAPQQKLFMARDRLGIKPLFYRRIRGRLVFASEIKGLLATRDPRPAPSREGIAEYLFCGYPMLSRTMFEDIHSVQPGHLLVASQDCWRIERYWDVTFQTAPPESDPAGKLHELLSASVRRELFSDAPLGSCLSGGLDSTVVTALATRDLPGLQTFNIGYARNSDIFQANPRRIVGEVVGDDAAFAKLAAGALHTHHHAFVLPVESLLDDIDTMLWDREKPLITLSEYGHHHLSRQVVKHVKVLLSGQGSDELFGGYYYWWQFKDPARTTFFPWVWRTDPAGADYPITAVDIMESLTTTEFRDATRYREAHQEIFDGIYGAAATDDFMNRISYLLVKTHLQEMLELEDRHSMAASLEIRVPYLDHRIVEWALNLPREVKMSGRTEKELLRTMALQHLPGFPPEVAARKKSPMPPPFDIEGLVGAMVERLRARGRALDAWCDTDRLNAFLTTFDHEAVGLIHQRHYALFSLYFLERWHRVFYSGDRGPS